MATQAIDMSPQPLIAARMEITDVLHRLCRALDARDEATIHGCFHFATGDAAADASARQFCDGSMRVLNSLAMTLHLIGNIEIEIAGDQASVASCFTSHSRTRPEGEILLPDCGPDEAIVLTGRYADRFLRHQARWGLTRREATIVATYRTPLRP